MLNTQGPRILVVEDDASIRETLSDLLTGEGYVVEAAEHAERGLELLERQKFDLVLTDYSLPGKTGTWMVSQAKRRDVLHGAPAVVITAHPTIENPDRLEVIRKPLDVDDFLFRVHALLAHARSQLMSATQDWFGQHLRPQGGPRKVELVLYISANSPSSLRALRNVQNLLQRYELAQLSFHICDLSREPASAADEDKIAFTPTLVKRSPEPRTWILGDLQNITVLEDLLVLAGVELKK